MLASKQLILAIVSIAEDDTRTSPFVLRTDGTATGTGTGPAARGDAAVPRAAARPRLIFAIVSIGLFMVSIDQTIVATALPAIEKELHAAINWSG